MAKAPTRKSSSKKPAAASETSESIAEQTKMYLKSGGKVEVVNSGISGQPILGALKSAHPRSSA